MTDTELMAELTRLRDAGAYVSLSSDGSDGSPWTCDTCYTPAGAVIEDGATWQEAAQRALDRIGALPPDAPDD